MIKVLLEPGVWLALGEGDPPRTLVEEYARDFSSTTRAFLALKEAREYRPFLDAVIQDNPQGE